MSKVTTLSASSLWTCLALAAMLLAGFAWSADQQSQQQQRVAALSELQAMAGERKQPINALLARFAAEVDAGVPESSPERLAELNALVQPRQRRRASEHGYLLGADGLEVSAAHGARNPSLAPWDGPTGAIASCLAGQDGSAIVRDGSGVDWVSATRSLPVHGLCLLLTADLRDFPAADRRPLAAALLAAAMLLLAAGLIAVYLPRSRVAGGRWRGQRDVAASDQVEARGTPQDGAHHGNFLGRLSHEVRTPLNGVLGTVELLLKTPLNPHQRELVELARASGDALLSAIDDILEHPRERNGPTDDGESPDLPRFPGARVLLVEDNPTNQLVARLMLTDLGCVVDLAADGRAALQRLEDSDYDAILMDCEMPVLDGFATTAAIRQRRDHKARLPIIAVTAQAMAGDRERCLAAGMDDYLSKPVTEDAIAHALQRRLRRVECLPAAPPMALAPAALLPETAINPAVIGRLRELAQATDPTLLSQILEVFRSDVAQHIAVMQAAAEAGDAEALRTAAHLVKGAGGTLGAAALTALAQRLYTLAPDTPPDVVSALLESLAREFARALTEIDRLEIPGMAAWPHENPDCR